MFIVGSLIRGPLAARPVMRTMIRSLGVGGGIFVSGVFLGSWISTSLLGWGLGCRCGGFGFLGCMGWA